jgi:hypothetical protein
MNYSKSQMNPTDFQSMNRVLRIAVNELFWTLSSRYDEEVLELVLDDIKNDKIDYSNYIIDNIDQLAYKLMNDKMIQVGHL